MEQHEANEAGINSQTDRQTDNNAVRDVKYIDISFLFLKSRDLRTLFGVSYKVITTMVIRPLDDRTYFARFPVAD